MTSLCRIAKYTPAAVLGLLVVLWALSSVWGCVLWIPTNPTVGVTVFCSRIGVAIQPGPSPVPLGFSYGKFFDTDLTSCLGWFLFDMTPGYLEAAVPIPALITGILPFAIGPFISFRFRIWHYLAFTALVALELAYYSRYFSG